MTKEEFEESLKNAKINKKQFAEACGISHGSVLNWGVSRKDGSEYTIPSWVASWIENYIMAKKYLIIKEQIDCI